LRRHHRRRNFWLCDDDVGVQTPNIFMTWIWDAV
jgi:hypothetical protein